MTSTPTPPAPGGLYDTRTGLRLPPADAVGLSAIRILPNGGMRQFNGVMFRRGWNGVEHFIRTLRCCGFVRPTTSGEPSYAVLDILNADGDIVADYSVPDARAWRYIYRKLQLRMETIPTEAVGDGKAEK